jgi:hypothetical protein
MSSVIIAGNVSGTITLDAPNVAGTTTLTLPTTSGNILTSASSIATSQLSGSIGASSLPTGSVIQVVQTRTNSTATYVRDDYLAALQTSITPSSASNKILVMITIGALSSDTNSDMAMDIYRGATLLDIGSGASGTNATFMAGGMNLSSGDTRQGVFNYLDSPATTSSIDYKFRCRINSPRTLYMNRRAQAIDYACISSVTLMEIKG